MQIPHKGEGRLTSHLVPFCNVVDRADTTTNTYTQRLSCLDKIVLEHGEVSHAEPGGIWLLYDARYGTQDTHARFFPQTYDDSEAMGPKVWARVQYIATLAGSELLRDSTDQPSFTLHQMGSNDLPSDPTPA